MGQHQQDADGAEGVGKDVRRGTTTEGKEVAGSRVGMVMGKDIGRGTTTKGNKVAGGGVGLVMGKDVRKGTTTKGKDGPGAAWAWSWASMRAGHHQSGQVWGWGHGLGHQAGHRKVPGEGHGREPD